MRKHSISQQAYKYDKNLPFETCVLGTWYERIPYHVEKVKFNLATIIILSIIIIAIIHDAVIAGNTIYVDKNNLFGNGCNNAWPGTIEQPKCDVDGEWFRSDLEPGDTVILREAKYDFMLFNESSGGTEDNPVVIKAYDGEKILLDNFSSNMAALWFFENASYITIE